MASDLEQKIIKQVEYYFGDINFPRDKFLQEKIKEDEGWIPIKVLLTFKRLASISDDPEVIAAAVEKSENKLVLVSEDKSKVKRNPEQPIPEQNEERQKELQKRSAYAKGFPLDEQLNDIILFMEPYGEIDCVIRRTLKDHKFKGSCFIVFKNFDDCKKFVELESVKYKETELIRKFQNKYHEDKKKEIEERKKAQKEKKEANEKQQEKQIELPKAAVIHFTGIPEGTSVTREELKEMAKEYLEAQFIDFNKGDLEGHIRFPAEGDAKEFLKKVEDVEVKIGEVILKFRLIEGDEEVEYLKKTVENINKMRQNKKFGKGNFRKRRGGFNHGGQNKRSRN
ncbi:unnamed protein product [Brassicogethes aeneus]|uniref:Uncharacterized protein n=1 Tax=Brassicogethes aeneus TaxID=1431903 RepID=A0A9P0FIH8_BRAAE|nr:unnamed protein product [Brassicogethes aeneus]